MESDAFFTCLAELRQNRPCVLATVLRREGSAPRGAGATMAVLENGRTVGTVGGGALEYEAVKRAMACHRERRSALLDYRLAPGAATSLNMVCGGDVTVLCQWVPPEDRETLAALTTLEAAWQKPGSLWLARLVTEGPTVRTAVYAGKEPLGERLLSREREAALGSRRAALWEDGRELVFLQPLRLAGHVYVFGGGHVAQRLTPLLAALEFAPVVFEDRPEYAQRELFPQAEDVILGSFAAVGDSVTLGAEDAAVIMTRGHAWDQQLLTQVLRSPVWYTGLMGSRSKLASTRDFLLREGFGQEAVARLHTPVGLMIGAETPMEIAVSVAGELVLCRARRNRSPKLPLLDAEKTV